ncbi:hypothetical protein SLEP1_g26926 [Rubroshorea leprosula]|uniref:F-box domain-containing protein n=1 Tax=Rubroshorea leprosula TaxID=152421 RepID=A0AAV5JUS2_9ROSI|nr:hypothetical protein SLEP1_g26926 [Rubroshorea leprosula]
MVMAKVLDDLSGEILCYLPVKSLLRFQCISKSWYSLIHSPRFIKSHLQQSPNTNSNSVLVALVKNTIGDFAQSHLCVAGIGSPDKLLKNNSGVDNIKVHGSCNGLICLSILNHYLVLSNMSTKDFHITPIPNPGPRRSSKFHYGLGYDSVNDDYKVVMIFLSNDLKVASPSPSCYAKTRIYSLRHNMWSETKRICIGHPRKLCNQGLPADASVNGVFARGALHWMTQRRPFPLGKISSSISILAFDVAAEAVQEIPLPEYLQNKTLKKGFDIQVGVLGGSLCLSSKDGIDDHYYDIWVLKDYMIQDSWTRLFQISTSMVTEDYMLQDFWTKLFQTSARVDSRVTALIPVGLSGHELLLGKPLGGFYCYNLEKEELRYAGTCGRGFYTAVICLGTLVSISDYKALWRESTRPRKRKRSRNKINHGETLLDDALRYFFRFHDKFNHVQSTC